MQQPWKYRAEHEYHLSYDTVGGGTEGVQVLGDGRAVLEHLFLGGATRFVHVPKVALVLVSSGLLVIHHGLDAIKAFARRVGLRVAASPVSRDRARRHVLVGHDTLEDAVRRLGLVPWDLES